MLNKMNLSEPTLEKEEKNEKMMMEEEKEESRE